MGRSRRVDVTAALKHPAPSTGLLYWHTIRACHILLPPLQRWAKEQMRHNLQFPISAYICVSVVIPFDHSHLWSASLLGQVAKALPYWHFVSDPTGSSPGASGIFHYTSVCICFIPKPLFILEPPPDFIHFCIQRHNLLIQFFYAAECASLVLLVSKNRLCCVSLSIKITTDLMHLSWY